MKNKLGLGGLITLLALSGIVLSGLGCAGDRSSRSTGTYIDDKTITGKVKAELFGDPVVSGFDVHVNTFEGNVQLNGFVNTEEQKRRASEIARAVPGVKWVKNNLVVKTQVPTASGAAAAKVETSRATGSNAADATRGEWERGLSNRNGGAPQIEMSASNGKATLRGTVSSEAEKESIEKKVREMPGIENIDNQLEVKRPNP